MSEFEKIVTMLQGNINYPFAKDCLGLVLGERKFTYRKGILMPNEHIYETYKTRSQIQKEITHAPIEGYDFLIPNLKDFSKPKTRIVGFGSLEVCYMIFCDEMFEILIGILKLPGADWSEWE